MLTALLKRYRLRRPPENRQALQHTLDAWRVEAPSAGLAQRILAQAAALPQAAAVPAPLEPRGVPIWPSPLLWPGAAAFALAVVLGYLAALHGQAPANDESLNVADAAALQEDFGDL